MKHYFSLIHGIYINTPHEAYYDRCADIAFFAGTLNQIHDMHFSFIYCHHKRAIVVQTIET